MFDEQRRAVRLWLGMQAWRFAFWAMDDSMRAATLSALEIGRAVQEKAVRTYIEDNNMTLH